MERIFSSTSMELFAITGFLNGLAAIGLASFIYFRSPRDPRHWTFGLFGMSTAIWSFGYFAWQVSETETYALFNLRLLMAGAIFIPITFLHHVLYLLGKEVRWQQIIKGNYILGAVFLVSDATPLFIESVRPISQFPFWGVPGLAFHFCLAWWLGLVVLAHVLLFQASRKEKGLPRRQIHYLLIGSTIGYVGGATNFPLWYGIEIMPYGTVCFGIYISIVAYTLLRFHWLDYSVYVEKGFSYFVLLLLLSQPIYPVLLLAQKWVFGSINPQFAIIQLIFHLLTVLVAFQMKLGTKGAVARTIMKGRALRIQTLADFSSKVTNFQSVPELGQAILQTLSKGAGSPKAALFSLQLHDNRYLPIATIGFLESDPLLKNGWTTFDDLPQWLLATRGKFSIEDLDPHDEWENEFAGKLKETGLELFYPIFGNNQLLGFLGFGPNAREGVQALGGKTIWDMLIRESALALENAFLREENRRTQGMLCEVDRLRSLETMANGLTQELHNPLVSIKAFVQVAQMRQHDGEFMDRLHGVVGEDLEKIEELTKEIREYVKPLANPKTHVHIHEVLDSCLLFITNNASYQQILIEKRLSPHIPTIRMDRQGLMQAIFNGLLFLLKDVEHSTGTLVVSTQSNNQIGSQQWFQVDIAWESDVPVSKQTLVSVESWDFRHVVKGDPAMTRGIILAAKIVQRHAGSFRLVTCGNIIFGFQIQLPTCTSYEPNQLVGSTLLSSSSSTQVNPYSDPDSLFS